MAETMEQSPVQGARFEMPMSVEAKATGVTGAIVERRTPGLLGETVSGAVMKALSRAGRSVQAPRGVAEQTVNRSGLGYATEQERAQFEARRQAPAAEHMSGAGSTQLLEADRQQTERALDTTRSALEREVATQAEPAKPQPQDRDEGATQPADEKAKKEREMATITIRSVKDGHIIGSFEAPKNATSEELNRAAQAAGLDYTVSPSWTTLHGLGIRGRDLWAALKKAVLDEAPPEAQQPSQKAA